MWRPVCPCKELDGRTIGRRSFCDGLTIGRKHGSSEPRRPAWQSAWVTTSQEDKWLGNVSGRRWGNLIHWYTYRSSCTLKMWGRRNYRFLAPPNQEKVIDISVTSTMKTLYENAKGDECIRTTVISQGGKSPRKSCRCNDLWRCLTAGSDRRLGWGRSIIRFAAVAHMRSCNVRRGHTQARRKDEAIHDSWCVPTHPTSTRRVFTAG